MTEFEQNFGQSGKLCSAQVTGGTERFWRSGMSCDSHSERQVIGAGVGVAVAAGQDGEEVEKPTCSFNTNCKSQQRGQHIPTQPQEQLQNIESGRSNCEVRIDLQRSEVSFVCLWSDGSLSSGGRKRAQSPQGSLEQKGRKQKRLFISFAVYGYRSI